MKYFSIAYNVMAPNPCRAGARLAAKLEMRNTYGAIEGRLDMANEKLAAKAPIRSAKVGKSSKPSNGYYAPALEKGLDILEALCLSETGLTQKEIAGRLDRSVNEIYRMLSCLVRREYVDSQNDKFSITSKLFQMSRAHPPTERLIAEALPAMQELAHKVGFACDLRVYSMGSQTVIASVNTPSGIGFNVRTGAEIAVAPTASGRVLIAFQTAETMEMRISESLGELPPKDLNNFRKDLHEVAVKGFASIKSRQYEGLYAVSFPILDMDHNAIAALTVPIVPRIDGASQATRAQVEDALRECTAYLNSRVS